MLIKQKSLALLRNLTFGELLIVFSVKKSAISPLFNDSKLSSASDKTKLFTKNFS